MRPSLKRLFAVWLMGQVVGNYILEFEQVTKEFPGVLALDEVSFTVEKGSIHAICGENGAGKSTLMKILCGIYPRETYSGTVSVAREGTLLGIPSFAISLISRESQRFEPAAAFAKRLALFIDENGLPQNTFLNVNVPDLDEEAINGYRITKQGKRIYHVYVAEETDSEGQKLYRIEGEEPGWHNTEQSDFEAVEENCISITPLHLDLTNHASLDELKNWRL